MAQLSVKDVADDIVDRLSGAPAAQRGQALAQLEIKGLVLRLDPGEEGLAAEPLRAVYRLWGDLPKVAGIADVMKVHPEQLRPALGYVMLVDAGPSEQDFRYALYGSEIARVSGFDMSGKSVWENPTTEPIRTFFAACYMAARRLRRPLYSVHEAPPTITVSQWHRLILPMGAGGEIKRFLVCNLPIHEGQVR